MISSKQQSLKRVKCINHHTWALFYIPLFLLIIAAMINLGFKRKNKKMMIGLGIIGFMMLIFLLIVFNFQRIYRTFKNPNSTIAMTVNFTETLITTYVSSGTMCIMLISIIILIMTTSNDYFLIKSILLGGAMLSFMISLYMMKGNLQDTGFSQFMTAISLASLVALLIMSAMKSSSITKKSEYSIQVILGVLATWLVIGCIMHYLPRSWKDIYNITKIMIAVLAVGLLILGLAEKHDILPICMVIVLLISIHYIIISQYSILIFHPNKKSTFRPYRCAAQQKQLPQQHQSLLVLSQDATTIDV